MPTYAAIDPGVPLDAGPYDLENFFWDKGGVAADFMLPDDHGHLLRIEFHGQCIVRLLDEMALSTEDDDGPEVGRVPDHFAYRVRDAAFERMQSAAWKDFAGPVTHYQFVTGWTCLDVLSAAAPIFTRVARA